MKILVVTVCRNEARMIDWFIRHYSFADAIHIWDNSSTDGGFHYLALPEKTEVQAYRYDTGGVLRDDTHRLIKSNHYRTQPLFDWVIVVDMDEFIYHPMGMRKYLELCDSKGIVLPRTQGFSMVGDGFPEKWWYTSIKSQEDLELIDLVTEGVPDAEYGKFAVFHSSLDMQYGAGCHPHDTFVGGVRALDMQQPTHSPLKLLHYRFWSEEDSARRASAIVLSPQNIQNKWGTGGNVDPEAQKAVYRSLREQRRKVI